MSLKFLAQSQNITSAAKTHFSEATFCLVPIMIFSDLDVCYMHIIHEHHMLQLALFHSIWNIQLVLWILLLHFNGRQVRSLS
jgi:hypothetical protein